MPEKKPPAPDPKEKSSIATRIFEELGKMNKRLEQLEERQAAHERKRARSSPKGRNIFGEDEEE